METEKIQRGIDFGNRAGETGWAGRLQRAFAKDSNQKLTKTTFLFLTVVFLLNLFFIYPIFMRNITPSFSSAALLMIADFFHSQGIATRQVFFQVLTVISLSFAPISFYLFVRKLVLRHDLSALFATLFFIVPNPFFKDGLPLIGAILNGDGAHAFVFAFIPILLLYIQAFIATGVLTWGFISIISTAAVAIISPFGFFNLLIMLFIIAISEGFLGNFRMKIVRLFYLCFFSIVLSLFWYYPNVFAKIIVLSHVQFAYQKFLSVLPLAIPGIPIFGALSFLIFDRREKLKPFFSGFIFFVAYYILFIVSKSFHITGIFTADRYLVELSFAGSFFLALLFVVLVELVMKNYFLKAHNTFILFLSVIVLSVTITYIGMISLLNIKQIHGKMFNEHIVNSYKLGIGGMERVFNIRDITSVIASGISLFALIILVVTLIKYPRLLKDKT